MRSDQSVHVQLYTKSGCSLCDKAKEVILQTAKEYPIHIEEIDIGGNSELLSRYGEEIPVVFVDGVKLFKFHVDPEKLRKAIRKRSGK